MHPFGHRLVRLVCFAGLMGALVISGCGPALQASYKLPFVPIKFVVDTNGTISVEADASVSTPIGDFGVGAAEEGNVHPPDNGFVVFIQRLFNGHPTDGGYQVNEDESEKMIVIDDQVTVTYTGKLLHINAIGHHNILLTSPHAPNGGQIAASQPQRSSAPVIYSNALTAPASGWDTDQNCFFASDGFHITPNLACLSPVQGLSDVDVSVQMKQISGAPTDQNGIEVRRVGNPASLYEFDIAANSAWLFKVCIHSFDNCSILASGSSWAIQTGLGAVNTVEVRAVGSHFALLVNGTQIGQADDTSIASGDVWLDSDGTSECVFTNFLVTRPT